MPVCSKYAKNYASIIYKFLRLAPCRSRSRLRHNRQVHARKQDPRKKADSKVGGRSRRAGILGERHPHERDACWRPQRSSLGHVLICYESSAQPQYLNLRASMLGYAHINLMTMLKRFEQDEPVGVATDSLYVRKSALHRLDGVDTYVPSLT